MTKRCSAVIASEYGAARPQTWTAHDGMIEVRRGESHRFISRDGTVSRLVDAADIFAGPGALDLARAKAAELTARARQLAATGA